MKLKLITLTTGFTMALGMVSNATAGSSPFTASLGHLPSGKSIIITHSVTVSPTTIQTSISSQATVSGSNFSPVLSDDPAVGGLADPTVTGIQQTPEPALSSAIQSGTNFVISVSNGAPWASWTLLSTTNLLPPALWSSNSMGTFDATGNLVITNLINGSERQLYYRISIP